MLVTPGTLSQQSGDGRRESLSSPTLSDDHEKTMVIRKFRASYFSIFVLPLSFFFGNKCF